mgnify:CR=1 FL=1
MKNFKTINVAVCQGRHDIPQATDGAVFGAIIIEMNPKKLLTQAQDVLKNDYKNRKRRSCKFVHYRINNGNSRYYQCLYNDRCKFSMLSFRQRYWKVYQSGSSMN